MILYIVPQFRHLGNVRRRAFKDCSFDGLLPKAYNIAEKREDKGEMDMQIVALDAKTLKPEELDLSPWRALGTLSLYDRTDERLVPLRLRGADVVLTNKVKLTREVLQGAAALKLVCVLATGFDGVDVAAARELGIPVCNVPGYATASVAQSVFAFLLEMTYHTALHSARIRQGAWTACPEFCWWERTPVELANLTLGVIGCGAIGSRVAAIARAFGMEVLGYSRHEHPDFPGRQVALDELLARSDAVSLHCPATAENRGLICAETIAKMKDGALLINTARGSLVIEADVAAALAAGKLVGYGADVVSREPIDIHNPLLKAPNCYLSGHCAWATLDARQRIVDVTAESIRGFLEGKPLHVVN